MKRLTQIDPTDLSEDLIEQLEELLKGEEMSLDKIRYSTESAKGLFQWVKAIRNYYFVYRDSTHVRNKLMMADLQLKKILEKKVAIEDESRLLQDEIRKMRADQKQKE